MIHIVFGKDFFEISGHAEYAEKGQDIVCAAVSFLALAVRDSMYRHNAVKDSTSDNGIMYVEFDEKLAATQYDMLQYSLKQLSYHYPNNIDILEE